MKQIGFTNVFFFTFRICLRHTVRSIRVAQKTKKQLSFDKTFLFPSHFHSIYSDSCCFLVSILIPVASLPNLDLQKMFLRFSQNRVLMYWGGKREENLNLRPPKNNSSIKIKHYIQKGPNCTVDK